MTMRRAFPVMLPALLLVVLTGCQSTGSLGGTSWTVLEVIATDETDIVDMDIDFEPNGVVHTTTTRTDGSREESQRQYSVHEATISVRRPQGDLHVLHRIDGDEMFLTAENFQARLMRVD